MKVRTKNMLAQLSLFIVMLAMPARPLFADANSAQHEAAPTDKAALPEPNAAKSSRPSMGQDKRTPSRMSPQAEPKMAPQRSVPESRESIILRQEKSSFCDAHPELCGD